MDDNLGISMSSGNAFLKTFPSKPIKCKKVELSIFFVMLVNFAEENRSDEVIVVIKAIQANNSNNTREYMSIFLRKSIKVNSLIFVFLCDNVLPLYQSIIFT